MFQIQNTDIADHFEDSFKRAEECGWNKHFLKATGMLLHTWITVCIGDNFEDPETAAKTIHSYLTDSRFIPGIIESIELNAKTTAKVIESLQSQTANDNQFVKDGIEKKCQELKETSHRAKEIIYKEWEIIEPVH